MRFVLVSLTIGGLVVGGVLLARNLAPPGPHFRREMAKDSANPAAQREAEVALRVQLAVLARAESAYVADSGRPTRQLPPRYGYTKRRSDITAIRVEQQGWNAMITHARTGMTCTMFAGLNRSTGTYLPGQPNCFSELGYDTVSVAAAPLPLLPTTSLQPTSREWEPEAASPAPGRHRDWGPVNNTPPPMPWIAKDECEGEGCSKSGSWAACSTMVALREKRIDAPAVFTIRPGERFSARTADVHVELPGIVVFHDTASNEGGEALDVDSIRFVPADTLYILNYIGEGYLVWWYRGRADTGYQFWSDEHQSGPAPSSVVSIQNQKSVWWVRVRNAAGKEGWIVGDYHRMATGGYMDEVERCLRPTK